MVYKKKTKEYLLHLDAKEDVFRSAKKLRNNTTDAEKALWDKLKNRNFHGLKFRRQHPIGRYIADFYCHEKRLVIEVDGGIHQDSSAREHDENRTAEFERFGIQVIRFRNDQVQNEIQQVLEEMGNWVIQSARISPSPSGEGAGG